MYKRALVHTAVLFAASRAQSAEEVYDLSPVYDTATSWLNLNPNAAEPDGRGYRQIMPMRDSGGMLWNKHAIPCGSYELTMELMIEGPGAVLQPDSRFEGLGIWFVDNTTTADIVDHYESGVDRELLNYRSDFVGFGSFLALENRQKGIKPSVSVIFNDGTPLLMDEVPTEFGLYWNFLEDSNLSVRFTVDNARVTTRVKRGEQTEWRKVSTVTGGMNVCGHLGISASNKRKGGRLGAELSLKSVTLTTANPSYLEAFVPEEVRGDDLPVSEVAIPVVETEAPELPAALEVERAESRLIPAPISPAVEAMMQQLGSQQKDLLRELHTLRQLMKLESARTQEARDRHQREQAARQEQLERALAEMKESLLTHGDSGAENIAESHKSIQHLQANAASLESTVRRATTYSTYFAGGLSVSFLIFGGLIYKRMKDMEKKHFL